MKKLLMPFFVVLICTAAFANDLPRIAVYVTGDVPDNERRALGTRMLASLINSGRYMGIERSAAFLAEIEREQVTQRSGAIDDSQISALGRQFGVKYVCVADITPAFGAFQVSARIVDVETAVVVFIGESYSPLKTTGDLTRVSDEVVRAMFGRQTASRQQSVQAMPAKPSGLLQKPTFWLGMGFDVIGAGLLVYGIMENGNVTGHSSRADAEKSLKNRNVAYAVGASALLAGITIHIFF
jgi:hypothetical protein